MAKQRIIDTKLWDDLYFSELKTAEKLIFIYLLTNTLTNISWIYEISKKRIIFDTWLNEKIVLEAIDKFWYDWKIYLFEWYIMIKKFINYQNLNPSVVKWIKRELNSLPPKVLQEFYWLNKETLTAYTQPATACVQPVPPNLTKPNLTKPNLKGTEITKNSIATKVATLEEYIKENFDLEFMEDIYNKWNITKWEFQEECESFINYRKEKNVNWKKERWEKEKTFDPKLRFRTWIKRSSKWNKQKKSNLTYKTVRI